MTVVVRTRWRCKGCKVEHVAAERPVICGSCGLPEDSFAGPMEEMPHVPGQLRYCVPVRLGANCVAARKCLDCDELFTCDTGWNDSLPFRINGVESDGLCPWCREDSEPWKHGRGL